MGMGCWALWSCCLHARKRPEGSDNVRMREVVGAIEHVSSRPQFSHGAVLSALPARGGLNITPHWGRACGRKGAVWDLLFLRCALLAAVLIRAGLYLVWCCLDGGCYGHGVLGRGGLCLAQEGAPACTHSPISWEMGHWGLWAEPWARIELQRDGGTMVWPRLASPCPALSPSSPPSCDFAPAAALPASGSDLDTCYFLYTGKA